MWSTLFFTSVFILLILFSNIVIKFKIKSITLLFIWRYVMYADATTLGVCKENEGDRDDHLPLSIGYISSASEATRAR